MNDYERVCDIVSMYDLDIDPDDIDLDKIGYIEEMDDEEIADAIREMIKEREDDDFFTYMMFFSKK